MYKYCPLTRQIGGSASPQRSNPKQISSQSLGSECFQSFRSCQTLKNKKKLKNKQINEDSNMLQALDTLLM